VSRPIEDYALIGDTQTAALIGRDGSLDWLCVPRFDSGSCFAALLGDERHGRWLLAPEGEVLSSTRRYRGDSLILETDVVTAGGSVRLTDFMPLRHFHPRVVRTVRGLEGVVPMRTELVLRFEYGTDIPWVRSTDRGIHAIAGPDAVCVDTTVELRGRDRHTEGTFTVAAGEEVSFVLSWHASHADLPSVLDPASSLADTVAFWEEWCEGIEQVHGEWEPHARRSLMTLKALTYGPTGGILAAATTSLPEAMGGVRNWDYRYCWVRDATLTLDALIEAGCREEAAAWSAWLTRAAAGAPEQLQIMYGVAGEQRCLGAVPARRLRRADGRSRPGSGPWHPPRSRGVELPAGRDGLRVHPLDRSRRRDLGGARPPSGVHPLPGHGLGGVRPGYTGGRAGRPGRSGGFVAGGA
jgi:GH15 family glucan-1,4-alpha-glucosidase